MSHGDMYGNPGDCPPLPTDLSGAIAAYESSPIAQQLGDMFSRSYVSIAAAEVDLADVNAESDDPDHVSQWDRDRFIEHC